MTKTNIIGEINKYGEIINFEIAAINNVAKCENDCKFIVRGSSTTLMSWSYVYDKFGNRSGSDPNILTKEYQCIVCKKFFSVKTQHNEIKSVVELK